MFEKAIEKAGKDENVKVRVNNLIDCITYTVFVYTTRGLFERDKLIFMAQVAFQILLMSKEIVPEELNFLLRFPFVMNTTSPVDFLSNNSWGGVKVIVLLLSLLFIFGFFFQLYFVQILNKY